MENIGKDGVVVVNINGKIKNSQTVHMQMANDVGVLYTCLKTYFERAILGDPDVVTAPNFEKLQRALNAKAKDVPELQTPQDKDGKALYSFESNQRVIELAVMVAIYETTRLIGQSSEHIIRPGWQIANQGMPMKNHTGEESWDGFLISIEKEAPDGMHAFPFELKSLMSNPFVPTPGDPNDQLATKVESFRSSFQTEASICTVLMMPYTNKPKLAVDMAYAANEMNKVVSDMALGFVCILSFPTDDDGKLNMSILTMRVPKNAEDIKIENVPRMMKEINFGKK